MLSRYAGNPDRRVISACVIPDVTGAGKPRHMAGAWRTERRGGVAGLTRTSAPRPRLASPERPPTPTSRSGILGWVAAADIAISLLLMIFVCVAGPSIVVPVIPPDLADPAAVVSPAPVAGHERHPDLLRDRDRRSWCRLRPGRGAARCPAEPPVAGGGRDRRDHRAGPAAARRVHGQPQLRGVRPDRPDRPQPVRDDAAQLRAIGDPIGLQTTRNWQTDPSLYGPVAIAVDWAAAKVGGITIA